MRCSLSKHYFKDKKLPCECGIWESEKDHRQTIKYVKKNTQRIEIEPREKTSEDSRLNQSRCTVDYHIFESSDWDSRCSCLLWSRREHNTRQATQRVKSGSRQLWKDSKKNWAIDRLAKPVIQIKDDEVVAIFRSQSEASIVTGISRANIGSSIKQYGRKSAGGYNWELA